jgi:hypothetical protein
MEEKNIIGKIESKTLKIGNHSRMIFLTLKKKKTLIIMVAHPFPLGMVLAVHLILIKVNMDLQ